MSEIKTENHRHRFRRYDADQYRVESHSGVRFHNNNRNNSTSSSSTTSTSNNGNPQQPREGHVIPSRVFVGNIPSSLSERDLGLLFVRFGKIRDVKILPDQSRNKSYGFVTFWNEADAQRTIQASAQDDPVMWGDRKLNVAQAVKRNMNHPSPTRKSTFSSLFAASTRVGAPAYYGANPLHASTPALFHTGGGGELATPQQQVMDDNAMYPTTLVCRLPHHFTVPHCQHQWNGMAPNAGHYFVTPGFQPYVQGGNQGSQYATTSYTTGYDNEVRQALPMSTTMQHGVSMPSLSPDLNGGGSDGGSSSASSSTITDGMSDIDGGDRSSVSSPQDKKDEQVDVQDEVGQQLPASAIANNAYPNQQTTMICCAHHSCMLSPVSPQAPPPNRPCMSSTSPTVATCYPMPNSTPFIYGSALPVQPGYGNPSTLRRASVAAAAAAAAARLQRWNSVDGSMHLHHLWGGNQTDWTQAAYGSVETGLHYATRQATGSLRPALSCQSHGVMLSPLCRSSFELNMWGHQQQFHNTCVDQNESAQMTSSSPALHMNNTASDIAVQQSNCK